MFGLLKSKKMSVVAPCDGEVVDLASVPDEVFAKKMAGDGVAIVPASNLFCAPCDGELIKIFDTNHAYIVKNKDKEVIVHIGIDSVNLKGVGFARVANVGDKLNAGDVVIEADLEYIAKNAKSTLTPIVVNSDKIENIRSGLVKQKDTIMEIK